MIWVVGYLPTPEGAAALDYAVHWAARLGAEVIVVNTRRTSDLPDAGMVEPLDPDALRARFENAKVSYELRQPNIGRSPAVEILGAAEEAAADQVILGMRRRSPVGKALVGSTTQQVLIQATCPVVAVKAPWAPPASGAAS